MDAIEVWLSTNPPKGAALRVLFDKIDEVDRIRHQMEALVVHIHTGDLDELIDTPEKVTEIVDALMRSVP